MEPKNEKFIEQTLMRRVAKIGGVCMKWVSPGHVGVPDRILILPRGRIIFVEVKTGTGKLSPVQIVMHRRLQALGARVDTVYGTDDVDKLIKEITSEL